MPAEALHDYSDLIVKYETDEHKSSTVSMQQTL